MVGYGRHSRELRTWPGKPRTDLDRSRSRYTYPAPARAGDFRTVTRD
jgi:hypothetical protein